MLSGGSPGPHKIQGIGAGFVPAVLNRDDHRRDRDRWTTRTRIGPRALCAGREGVLAGISCGAALWGADRTCGSRPEMRDKRIVVIMPDSGERYVSTPFFAP